MLNKFKTYFKAILIPVLVGGIVGFLISGSIDYNSLEKPFLSPPSITFPIVWTFIFIYFLTGRIFVCHIEFRLDSSFTSAM